MKDIQLPEYMQGGQQTETDKSAHRKTIIEIMADVEHNRWSKWQKYLHSLCVKNKDGSLTIPKSRVEHWEMEIATPYSELSEELKEYDRAEARTTVKALAASDFIIKPL